MLFFVHLPTGLYVMFDVAYYLRGIYTAVAWTIQYRVAKSYSSKSHVFRTNLLSPSITWGICWFTDLDLMFHMNNSRYLRECDFARYKYLISCGLGAALRKTGYTMVLGCMKIKWAKWAKWAGIVSTVLIYMRNNKKTNIVVNKEVKSV